MQWRFGKAAIWLVAAVLAVVLAAPLATPLLAQGKVARPNVHRPDGQVWQVIRTNCISCHGIDDYAFYAQGRDGWEKIIADKHKDGGATLSDKDMSILLDYLVDKFGPNNKPFPRSYIPAEITTYFTNPEAFRILNRSCTVCHDLTRASDARYPEDQWRVVLLDMRERGAKINDDEIEHMVEWLGRVWGTNQDK
jgi:mono/diheme cytochrome c family protein